MLWWRLLRDQAVSTKSLPLRGNGTNFLISLLLFIRLTNSALHKRRTGANAIPIALLNKIVTICQRALKPPPDLRGKGRNHANLLLVTTPGPWNQRPRFLSKFRISIQGKGAITFLFARKWRQLSPEYLVRTSARYYMHNGLFFVGNNLCGIPRIKEDWWFPDKDLWEKKWRVNITNTLTNQLNVGLGPVVGNLCREKYIKST